MNAGQQATPARYRSDNDASGAGQTIDAGVARGIAVASRPENIVAITRIGVRTFP